MRFAAFGRTKMLLDAAEACADAGHELVLVGTADPAPEYGAGVDDYEALAQRHECRFFTRRETGDEAFAEVVADAKADLAISMNWPALVPRGVRDGFRYGVL